MDDPIFEGGKIHSRIDGFHSWISNKHQKSRGRKAQEQSRPLMKHIKSENTYKELELPEESWTSRWDLVKAAFEDVCVGPEQDLKRLPCAGFDRALD